MYVDNQVHHDFDRARHRAFLRDAVAIVGRRKNDLIPYHEIRNRVSVERESYRGIQAIPLNQIVGSVDRFRDFDRTFLPRQGHTAGRWKSIDKAFYQDVNLPPIQVYKVGDIYFVKDGNHRVSVAREKGAEFIDAEVIEGHIRVPLWATMTPDELLLQVEYAEFLRHTDLDRLRPHHDIRPTSLGRYDEIWGHILAHRESLSVERGTDVPLAEAVTDWYDSIYEPITRIAREHGALARLTNRTEADVYLWVANHRDHLQQDDEPVDLEAAAVSYASQTRRGIPSRFWRVLSIPRRILLGRPRQAPGRDPGPR